jgi:phosphoribosylaminoimidazole-succinocarboxamide synthase
LDDKLLIVATDRISAFDVVLPCGIPNKGAVLTQLSAFWFEKTSHLMPNHLVEVIGDVHLFDAHCTKGISYSYPSYLVGRSMIVKKAQLIPVECVVRGYLAGSAWAEYVRSGRVSGIPLPWGLKECQQLPQPLFTPTTKAEVGHDFPLIREELINMVGQATAEELQERSLALYHFAEKYARTEGIIIADTKIEFGLIEGELILIDELFTPDSSRFWDADNYEAGHPQPSFDKQIVRDWLVASGWNKEPPALMLPPEIIEKTAEKYWEAYHRLTGRDFIGVQDGDREGD